MTRQILPRNDNEVIEQRVKFEEIPLSAVGIKTRLVKTKHLNNSDIYLIINLRWINLR